jgi:hypothetical protein
MRVYMYACMYAFMPACMPARLCGLPWDRCSYAHSAFPCMCACMHACVYACKCVCMHACAHTHMCNVLSHACFALGVHRKRSDSLSFNIWLSCAPRRRFPHSSIACIAVPLRLDPTTCTTFSLADVNIAPEIVEQIDHLSGYGVQRFASCVCLNKILQHSFHVCLEGLLV